MSSEIELKFSLSDKFSPSDVFNRLSLASPIREITMKSTYFDTEDNLLGKIQASLRHRMENETSVFTIKTPFGSKGALTQRGEWQVESEDLTEALPLLLSSGAPKEVLDLANAPLITVAEFEFMRKCALVTTDSFSAELCVDIGYLSPDGVKKTPLREVEIELIEGDISALCKFGEDLKEKFSLIPQSLSKLVRARNLK